MFCRNSGNLVNKDGSSQLAMCKADLDVFCLFPVCVCACVCVRVVCRSFRVIPMQPFAEEPRVSSNHLAGVLFIDGFPVVAANQSYVAHGFPLAVMEMFHEARGQGARRVLVHFWRQLACPGYRASAEDQRRASWLPKPRPSSSRHTSAACPLQPWPESTHPFLSLLPRQGSHL